MNRYPTFNTESKKLVPRAIDVETLSEQLIPIRDAFLKVFDGARARSRGELHRLELGLTITEQGTIAFTGLLAYVSSNVLESGEAMRAPPPKPIIASPVASPGRSGNHLINVETGEM